LSSIASWIAEGRVASARRVLHEVLRAPILVEEPALLTEVAELLERTDEYESVTVPVDAPDERHALARERMHLSPA